MTMDSKEAATSAIVSTRETPSRQMSPSLLRQADTLAHVTDALLCTCDLEPVAADIDQLHGAARRLFRCACRTQSGTPEGPGRSSELDDALGTVRRAYGSAKSKFRQQGDMNWRTQIAWRDVEDCCRNLAGTSKMRGEAKAAYRDQY